MKAKEFSYYGTRMRPYFRIPGLSVSEDGKTVLRQYEKDHGSNILPQRPPKKLTVRKDMNGYPYVNTRDYGKLMVDELVATCFCSPCPGPDYELIHKDGNSRNCHYQNIELRKKQPVQQATLQTTRKYTKLSNGLTVHCDGTVYDKKEKLSMSISHYDIDTGFFFQLYDFFCRIQLCSFRLYNLSNQKLDKCRRFYCQSSIR